MTQPVTWDVNGSDPTTVLDENAVGGSTDLDSLAGGAAALSIVLDNTVASPYVLMDMELRITFGVAPTAGKTIDIYILYAMDGTTYADGSVTGPVVVATHHKFSVPVRAVTSEQVFYIDRIPISARKFKVLLVNSADQAFHASAAKSVKILRYRPGY